MSKSLVVALAAAFGLSALSGCSHFHRDRAPEPAFVPVAEVPAPVAEPTYRRKWR